MLSEREIYQSPACIYTDGSNIWVPLAVAQDAELIENFKADEWPQGDGDNSGSFEQVRAAVGKFKRSSRTWTMMI